MYTNREENLALDLRNVATILSPSTNIVQTLTSPRKSSTRVTKVTAKTLSHYMKTVWRSFPLLPQLNL